jgi:hypothetical protein
MRKGLFLGALMFSALLANVALADRSDADDKNTRGQQIKERVLDKQREGFTRHSHDAVRTSSKEASRKLEHARPHGDVYGDQATRSTTKPGSNAARNLSATNSVNNPSEVRAMKRMINPMLGAYRTSQASEGAESYGGSDSSRMKVGSGSSAKNFSATGAVNTPAEIKQMLKMINPMNGAYRTSQASEGAESYGGADNTYASVRRHQQGGSTASVHFVDERGKLQNQTVGNTATAMKNRELRQNVEKMIKAKMAHKANAEGK